MGDPLSTAASVVGIVVPALHGFRLLMNDLERLTDAPETVKSLKQEINLVEVTTQSFLTITEPQWVALGTNVVEQSKTTLTTCKESCEKFRADLLIWTKHSSDGKLSWRDRARVGFFKQNQIEAMSGQLRTYRGSLHLVASEATLQYSILNSRVTQDIKDSIVEKAVEIDSFMATTSTQLAAVNSKLENLDLGIAVSDVSDYQQDQGVERSILTQERIMLRLCRELLEAIKTKNEEGKEHVIRKERDQLTTITFGNNNQGSQIGVNHGPISGFSFGGQRS
ncbi:hypothetical protein F5Y19DRAFT_244074 [Xylariaceae sp. FL1651]|nr:hypothetical protein F5Y19DRAFT_244074 [Xylariaceae sp. FL1651]